MVYSVIIINTSSLIMRPVGILLVVVGFVLLLKNLGYITVAVWDIVWPVAVILIGISLFSRHRRYMHGMWGTWCKGKCKEEGGHCETCTCEPASEKKN